MVPCTVKRSDNKRQTENVYDTECADNPKIPNHTSNIRACVTVVDTPKFSPLLDVFDINSIRNNEFLTDQAIDYFINYFHRKLDTEQRSKMEVVSPSVVQLIKTNDDDQFLRETVKSLGLQKKVISFLPVNDNLSYADGGHHWSLLVYVSHHNAFYHYDSFNGMNNDHAFQTAKKIFDAFENTLLPEYYCCICPQQDNAIDCGLFVIRYAKSLMELVVKVPDCRADNDLLESISLEGCLSRGSLLSILSLNSS